MRLRKRRRYLNRTHNPLGRRCPGFHPGCMICQSYRYFDQHGRFPTFDEASDLAYIANRLIAAIEDSTLPEHEKKRMLEVVDRLGASDLARYDADEEPLPASVLSALQADATRYLPRGEIHARERMFDV